MSSLRQLLAAHAPLLMLDAASARVQVGWLTADGKTRWETDDTEAGIALFRSVERLGIDPGDAGAFVYCDGPGSILGVRTSAMALRTWQVLRPRPQFAYHSLALVAAALGQPGTAVIADARRDTWHRQVLGGPLQRVLTADLTGPLVMPEGFRNWTPLPARVTRVPYAVAELIKSTADADLFREVAEPDAFLHEEPSYVTWTPQVHRAP